MTDLDIQESGPWTVDQFSDGRIVIQSQDFRHDAALELSGDFETQKMKRAYAEEIARRLNEARRN